MKGASPGLVTETQGNITMKYGHLQRSLFISAISAPLFLLSGCSENKGSGGAQRQRTQTSSEVAQGKGDQKDQTANPFAQGTTGGTSDGTLEATGTDQEAQFENRPVYLAIEDADATVKKTVEMGPSGVIEGMNVPQITITRTNADHVQMVRCAASYQDKMVTLSGEDIRHVIGRPNESSELEWVWAQAKEDRHYCKIVGTNIAMDIYSDLTAPKGEFFYIINPCVGKEHSLSRKEGCSNKISLTQTIKVVNSLSKEIQAKSIELAAAESSLNAHMQNAISLARKIEIHLRACEDQIAHDQQMLDFKKGLVQLGMLTVGAAIGYSIGGPNGAVMVGQLSMMLGSQLLFMKALKWPPYIANECIDSNVVATTAEQRKKAAKNDATNTAQNAGKYEEEFQVQALTAQLQTMLDPEKGPIALETQRVQKILEEMKELDIKVLTVDQAKAKASNQGIDITKPETFADPNASGLPGGAGLPGGGL